MLDIIFFGSPYSANMILQPFRLVSRQVLSLFYYQEPILVVYNAQVILILTINILASIASHVLLGISWAMNVSLGCVCYNSRHGEQFLMVFLYHHQYFTNKWINLLIDMIFNPVWLLWSCIKACCWMEAGTYSSASSTIPSITARTSWNIPYSCICCLASVLVNANNL